MPLVAIAARHRAWLGASLAPPETLVDARQIIRFDNQVERWHGKVAQSGLAHPFPLERPDLATENEQACAGETRLPIPGEARGRSRCKMRIIDDEEHAFVTVDGDGVGEPTIFGSVICHTRKVEIVHRLLAERGLMRE